MRGKLLLALTLANVCLLAFSLAQIRVAAAANAQAPILRGRALEIVDDQGRVRSTLTVIPADAKTGYPETVLLRLIDSERQDRRDGGWIRAGPRRKVGSNGHLDVSARNDDVDQAFEQGWA